MEIIITLVAIISAVELYRFWLSVRPLTMKRHFKSKLQGTKQMRWDLEFKKAKTQAIREDVRKEYDVRKAQLMTLQEQIKTEKDKGEKARLKDEVVRTEQAIERHETQMQGLDMQIHGSKPTNQYPDGYTGITQQIESFIEVEGMLKEYIRQV